MRDKIKVQFNNVSDVSKFVRIVSQYDGDFDLYCGSYCVDAKSILGIMTLDLKGILWMTSNCEQSDKEKLIRELKPVICA
ncbi:MAG: HPr family phosphocarrier protein [Lachnospiraceae bacterium]|nr:HPr family phosphocarrier protein [Lachnospiraceae bacterium]